jgi:hypothetical protein
MYVVMCLTGMEINAQSRRTVTDVNSVRSTWQVEHPSQKKEQYLEVRQWKHHFSVAVEWPQNSEKEIHTTWEKLFLSYCTHCYLWESNYTCILLHFVQYKSNNIIFSKCPVLYSTVVHRFMVERQGRFRSLWLWNSCLPLPQRHERNDGQSPKNKRASLLNLERRLWRWQQPKIHSQFRLQPRDTIIIDQ